jgi:hypothetical protein
MPNYEPFKSGVVREVAPGPSVNTEDDIRGKLKCISEAQAGFDRVYLQSEYIRNTVGTGFREWISGTLS